MEYKFDQRPLMLRAHPILFLFFLALTFSVTPIGLILFVVWILKVSGERIKVSNEEVYLRIGLLSKAQTELHISDIKVVKVYQGPIDRLFSVGTLAFTTAGDSSEIKIRGIAAPNAIKEFVKSRMAYYRNK